MYERNMKMGAHKGGKIVWFEPSDMTLLKLKPGNVEVFRWTQCLRFYHKLYGHHMNVAYKFSLNYDGKSSRVGDLVIPATERYISIATGILPDGEEWFKGTTLDLGECRHFFNKEYQDIKLTAGAPRGCITKEIDELLKVIQRYFTYEGRFNMVYAYHIRLLMHFTSLKALNLPYFLNRIIGKMAGKIQGNPKNFEIHLFHCGLIKLLIVKELGKRKKTWGFFLEKLGYQLITPISPKEKGTSSSKGMGTSTPRKKQGRGDIEEVTPSEVQELSEKDPATARKRGKKLNFHTEKEEQQEHVKLDFVPSQDLKPREMKTQSSDKERKTLDT